MYDLSTGKEVAEAVIVPTIKTSQLIKVEKPKTSYKKVVERRKKNATPIYKTDLCEFDPNGLKRLRELDHTGELYIICVVISKIFNIKIEYLYCNSRKKEYKEPRQYAHYFAKILTQYSLATIGKAIGNKDHATVLHSKKKVEEYDYFERTNLKFNKEKDKTKLDKLTELVLKSLKNNEDYIKYIHRYSYEDVKKIYSLANIMSFDDAINCIIK